MLRIIRKRPEIIIDGFVGGIFLAAAILTFGNAGLVERITIGVAIFTAITMRKNLSLLITITAYLAIIMFEEVVFRFADFDSLLQRLLIYILCAIALISTRYSKVSMWASLALICSILADIYWGLIDYQRPFLFYYLALIGLYTTLMHLIWSKPIIVDRLFRKPAESVELDWVLFKVSKLLVIIFSLNCFEYILRHTTSHNPLIVYQPTPFGLHAINFCIIWFIFKQAYTTYFQDF